MDIALYTIRTIALIITQPISVLGILVFAFVFYRQNKKTVVMQKMIIGEPLDSPFELTISQIVIGIIAGVIGSVILSYLGVVFDEYSAIGLIFLVSLLLMFINPKLICFSYSGAIIGFISVILRSCIGKQLDTLITINYDKPPNWSEYVDLSVVNGHYSFTMNAWRTGSDVT